MLKMRDIHNCRFCDEEILTDSRRRFCNSKCKYQYTRKLHTVPGLCGICDRPEKLMKKGIPINLVKGEYCNECWRKIQAAKLLLGDQKHLDEYWACAQELIKV